MCTLKIEKNLIYYADNYIITNALLGNIIKIIKKEVIPPQVPLR